MKINNFSNLFYVICDMFPQMYNMRLILDNCGEIYFYQNKKGPYIRADINIIEGLPEYVATSILAHEFGHAYDMYENSRSRDPWEREYSADYTGQCILNTLNIRYHKSFLMQNMLQYFIDVLGEDPDVCTQTHPSHQMRIYTLNHRMYD